jgi:peroxiredoxin (alkyl hydroperoxide reductase subunit C)
MKYYVWLMLYGEVCPAGWQKGDSGMRPTAEGVSEYLASNVKKL